MKDSPLLQIIKSCLPRDFVASPSIGGRYFYINQHGVWEVICNIDVDEDFNVDVIGKFGRQKQSHTLTNLNNPDSLEIIKKAIEGLRKKRLNK
jgi:hypothetical protein